MSDQVFPSVEIERELLAEIDAELTGGVRGCGVGPRHRGRRRRHPQYLPALDRRFDRTPREVPDHRPIRDRLRQRRPGCRCRSRDSRHQRSRLLRGGGRHPRPRPDPGLAAQGGSRQRFGSVRDVEHRQLSPHPPSLHSDRRSRRVRANRPTHRRPTGGPRGEHHRPRSLSPARPRLPTPPRARHRARAGRHHLTPPPTHRRDERDHRAPTP